MSASDLVITKFSVGIAALSAAAASNAMPGLNDLSVPLLGVPLTVITMSAAGAACAFAWPQGESSRAKLFGVFAASTFVGASCVSVIPHLFGLAWPRELQGALALLFGMLAPWAVPAARSALPLFFRGVANTIVRSVQPAQQQYEPEEYIPRNRRTPEDGDA